MAPTQLFWFFKAWAGSETGSAIFFIRSYNTAVALNTCWWQMEFKTENDVVYYKYTGTNGINIARV